MAPKRKSISQEVAEPKAGPKTRKTEKTPVGSDAQPPVKAESSSGVTAIVKREVPDRKEMTRMLSKMSYMKNRGNSAAHDEYNSLDTEGKRAFFWDKYKLDPKLSEYSNVQTSRSFFRTVMSMHVVGIHM
jgi:hypothetical protein